MLDYYSKSEYSGAIHIVGDFPAPKRDGHTQCGRNIEGENLIALKRSTVHNAPEYRFCLKCCQLLGLMQA